MNTLKCLPMLGVLSMFLSFGCAEPSSEPPAELTQKSTQADHVSAQSCLDEDGDGFGEGCEEGEDCNDNDDTISDDCTCTEEREGCGCELDAMPVECHMDLPSDTRLCKNGLRYCRDGRWTGCEGVAAFAE